MTTLELERLPEMEYRFLGHSGLKVSVIALGGWLTYGDSVNSEKAFACLKAAYDAGINFFDCAEVYAGGDCERIMGDAIRKFGWKTNDLVISTKIYWGFANGDIYANNVGLSRKHIIEGMDEALKRLQLERVTLVYAHRPDRQTPMEEIVRAFNYLIDTGRAFYWGTSEWNADEIANAWGVARQLNLIGPLMEQTEYNMLERAKVEKEYCHLYREYSLGLTTFSPLKQGILTGKYKNGVPDNSRFTRAQIEKDNATIEQVARLEPIAERLGVSQTVLALAWVLKNRNVNSAIIGARSAAQVIENIEAINAYKMLTDEVILDIENILGNKPSAFVDRY